ncbi:MAG TPA: DUF3536 domain-containing protein [Pyrinomonadaceae bacterium]|nr:DUF3536 domain-containing protein [Pyrinomonadaceae bacterium]
MTALVIHGHFYQPPRENPWTGEVEREAGAEPYHDWNERIHAECYGPNAFAHIVTPNGIIQRTVSNYAKISFNFGPTLLSWLERHHPRTYERILEADKISVANLNGHGNAIAQAYNHAILPLCNERDKLTQVLWGMADFRYRFGREPEALWLPETACNDETLSLLIEQGLRFVILAPGQARAFRLPGETEWRQPLNGDIDTSGVYRYFHRDGSGRSIAIFLYNGPLARAIAFEKTLVSSQALVAHFKLAAMAGGSLVNAATDGETYGHHFKFGDLCLAHALLMEAPDAGFTITNYGEYLDLYPPEVEVEISNGPDGEGTSWSCAHGVGRWIRNCGCASEGGWSQQWRGPLRAALNFLRDQAAWEFEALGSELFVEPWTTRNDYIQLVLDNGRSREEFLRKHRKRDLSPADEACALTLLEIQRNSMLMFTSCGWFFAEVSGIEARQVMKYAARVIELMDELGMPSPRSHFLEILAEGRSNLPEMGTAADVYLRFAEPPAPSAPGVADREATLS